MEQEAICSFPQGHVLFREGEPADTAYIIESGTIAITTEQAGEPQLLSELGPGEILGEMALIDAKNRTATATCSSPCRLKVIHRDTLVQRIEAADPIIRHLLELTLQRYRQQLHADDPPARPAASSGGITEAMDKLNLEADLRQALQEGQLQCVYQPIQDLARGRIAGFEALTRWQHPRLGPINPEAFINLAEETDLIVPIGLHNLRQACLDLQAFQAQVPDCELFMSINVSGRQLHNPAFSQEVLRIVEETGTPPRQIKLEITESLVVDFERVRAWISESKAHGFRISLDDFGTGYSGMGLLCQLDLNTLKIDKSFVQAMFDSRCEAVVLETMVHLGLGLELDIIAEGVETEAHENRLRELGVQFGQGYLYARPLGREEILASQLLVTDCCRAK